jgi:hypothetical protein
VKEEWFQSHFCINSSVLVELDKSLDIFGIINYRVRREVAEQFSSRSNDLKF